MEYNQHHQFKLSYPFRILATGGTNGIFLVMDYIDGESMRKKIERGEKLI